MFSCKIANLVFQIRQRNLNEDLLQEVENALLFLIEQLPEPQKKLAKLALLIENLKEATSLDEVESLLVEGMKRHLVTTLMEVELEEARNNPRKRNFLVYLKGTVWAPIDWQNRAQQALCLTARRTLGRLKRAG